MDAYQLQEVLSDALCLPDDAACYAVGKRLEELYPDRAIISAEAYAFRIEEYAKGGHCRLHPSPLVFNEFLWRAHAKRGVRRDPVNVWYRVRWGAFDLEVLILSCSRSYAPHQWILAESREIAEDFLSAVCAWNREVRGEILVFQDGGWAKDDQLYQAIGGSTFANLILEDDLAHRLRTEAEQFFKLRDAYRRYEIPWKRGILLTGPPGNGKSHAIKALVNHLKKPCLYVKSIEDSEDVGEVFERARQTAPCVLVLEDLDGLIDDRTRTSLLNEMDGFASNAGLLSLATTNHPEKLDEAIIDRPSRFDRKYRFEPPGPDLRRRFLQDHAARLHSDLQIDPQQIDTLVDATNTFSYAYLKELFVSAMSSWMAEVDGPRPERFPSHLQEQAEVLRDQLKSNNDETKQSDGDSADEDDSEDESDET